MAFIIAEAGSNHNRDIDIAFRLIETAAQAGCDAVKFQTFQADKLFTKFVPDFANYQDILGLLNRIQLPREWQKDLYQYCVDKRIEFMSTPFDEEAIDQLMHLGVKRMKIAGFESQDPRFVKAVAATQLPIIISLGIGAGSRSRTTRLSTITEMVGWIYTENPDADITILHCNNAYPTPYSDINLGSMLDLTELLKMLKLPNIKVGLSDHTIGIVIPPVAVGMGAKCIEKHFTLNNNMEGPDHHFAIEPNQLFQMVKNIRIVEDSIGTKSDPYTPSEQPFAVGTRVLVAKETIKEGEKLTSQNVTTKRGHLYDAVVAADYYLITGNDYHCVKEIPADGVVTWKNVHQILPTS